MKSVCNFFCKVKYHHTNLIVTLKAHKVSRLRERLARAEQNLQQAIVIPDGLS